MSIGANGNVNAGYRGIATIAGNQVRFADANITARQEIEAPDLIMGDWDHDAYVYGKIEVGGTVSGPVTQTFTDGANSVLAWACGRTDPCGTLTAEDVKLYYFCGSSREFTNLFVNSLSISCAAGEVAQFSVDVVGTGAAGFVAETPPHFTTPEKLVTWDKVNVTVGGTCDEASIANLRFSNFEFTVANNVETVYGLGQTDLFPFDIVPGLRTITGSLSVYNTPDFNGQDTWDDYCAEDTCDLTFTLGEASCAFTEALTITMKVRFHRIEPTSSVGPIISTVGFTGVTHQSGFPWDTA